MLFYHLKPCPLPLNELLTGTLRFGQLEALKGFWYSVLPSFMPSVPHAINYEQMFFINKQRTPQKIFEVLMPMFKSGIVIKLHEQ